MAAQRGATLPAARVWPTDLQQEPKPCRKRVSDNSCHKTYPTLCYLRLCPARVGHGNGTAALVATKAACTPPLLLRLWFLVRGVVTYNAVM